MKQWERERGKEGVYLCFCCSWISHRLLKSLSVSLYPFCRSQGFARDSLFALKKSLNASSSQLADWNQNMVTPCDWTSVTCTNNEVVKVTLTSMGLSGTLKAAVGGLRSLSIFSVQDNDISGGIPNEFGNLSDLTKLDLSENQLTGEIPRSLGNLAKLQYLLLSENNLEGSIPDSLTNISTLFEIQLAFNNLTGVIPNRLFQVPQYNFTGNKLNCGLGHSNPCESALQDSGKKEKSVTGVAFGSIGAVLGCVILGGIIFIWWKGRRKVYRPEVFVDVSGEDGRRITFGQLKRFAWRELQLATDNFNERNVLGQGGFGKVYKGVLTDNTRIAVKRLTDHQSAGGAAAFLREVELISVAVHRKLLRLIGFCITPSERLLVYPFMQNLSVASRLREIKPGEEILDWPTRKRIALGTARGLEYLHEHCNPKIIHRDVKAANVLLNEEFEAVVGDFGLAKLVDLKQTDVTTQVRGTMGHIAPEYLSTGKSSERTDVFGYGITLLELVTGKRAIELSRLEEEEDVLLLDHVKKLEREKRLYTIVDPNLKQNYDGQGVEMMIQVALLCTQASPEDRPKMPEVVLMLERQDLAEMWLQWQQVEHTRRQEYERMQQRFDWEQNSVYNQEAIELSGAR